MITNVKLSDEWDGECYAWILTWQDTSTFPTSQERELYAVDTVEEAIQDTLEYFGGLVAREDICIKE